MIAKTLCFTLCLLVGTAVMAQSGEEQAARQARSVHVNYQGWGDQADIFYIEVRPEVTYAGTYFCALAFDGGYCGIQEPIGTAPRMAIFSVWEPSNPHDYAANPNAVQQDLRTKILYTGKEVTTRRFGGEGTGGQSTLSYPWKTGQALPMAISCKPGIEPGRTAYTCWIWRGPTDGWFRMATFSTRVGGGKNKLRGPYSFVEDFFRNVVSKSKLHQGAYINFYAYVGGEWKVPTSMQFTGDSNTLVTIDAEPLPYGARLKTGADTVNKTVRLWARFPYAKTGPDTSADRRATLLTAVRAAETNESSTPQPAATATPAAN